MAVALIVGLVVVVLLAALVAKFCFESFNMIGPAEFGLVNKRYGKKLPEGDLIATAGEAGYQAQLLMPGMRFKLWPIYRVTRYPLVQVPPGEIGVVVAQVGEDLPAGSKSGEYKPEFGAFRELDVFQRLGGQRGVQRPVLPPGTTQAMHPIAFLVRTRSSMFGEVLSEASAAALAAVEATELVPYTISPEGHTDKVGVVTTLEGRPAKGIASRLGDYDDVKAAEANGTPANTIISNVLAPQNDKHNNYQDFQSFLDAGGCIGLQHDPLLYGSYMLNPFLVRVEIRDMLVVKQGEVAVIKAYVGLPTEDTSGDEFKFGSIVAPGHQGIWSEPLRTGKYTLNPRIYEPEIVPTSILTLNWASANSEAHNLDASLSSIHAKSKEAFDFSIDLQVQIHVPDTKAPKVISMVATMQNLVNEVLQSAVGNYFRNALQRLGAAEFITKRDAVQAAAESYIKDYLTKYQVEVPGVYIQDVVFPPELVKVLTEREIAAQQKDTYHSQQEAEKARIDLENQKGVADAQGELAKANVSVQIEEAHADAAVKQAEGAAQVALKQGQAAADVAKLKGDADAHVRTISGEADARVLEVTGTAEASATEAKGLAEAKATQAKGLAEAKATQAKGLAVAEGYEKQQAAIGREQTALVAALHEIGSGHVNLTPHILVNGGDGGGGLLTVLMTQLMGKLDGGPGANHFAHGLDGVIEADGRDQTDGVGEEQGVPEGGAISGV